MRCRRQRVHRAARPHRPLVGVPAAVDRPRQRPIDRDHRRGTDSRRDRRSARVREDAQPARRPVQVTGLTRPEDGRLGPHRAGARHAGVDRHGARRLAAAPLFGSDLSVGGLATSLQTWASDPYGPNQVNASIGLCEDNPALDGLLGPAQAASSLALAQAATEGRAFFAATGDTGAGCAVGATAVNGVTYGPVESGSYPASDPNATGVGGTVSTRTARRRTRSASTSTPGITAAAPRATSSPSPRTRTGSPRSRRTSARPSRTASRTRRARSAAARPTCPRSPATRRSSSTRSPRRFRPTATT